MLFDVLKLHNFVMPDGNALTVFNCPKPCSIHDISFFFFLVKENGG